MIIWMTARRHHDHRPRRHHRDNLLIWQTISVNGNYECTFTATVTGNPGDTHTNMVTACDILTPTSRYDDEDGHRR
ncbi:MAG: hypothetical protein R3C44_21435 [Chloroflexota bacterium]